MLCGFRLGSASGYLAMTALAADSSAQEPAKPLAGRHHRPGHLARRRLHQAAQRPQGHGRPGRRPQSWPPIRAAAPTSRPARPRREASPRSSRDFGVEIVDSIDDAADEGRRGAAGERRRPAAPGAGQAGAQGRQAGVHRQAGRRLAGRRHRRSSSWPKKHERAVLLQLVAALQPGIAQHAQRRRRSARCSAATAYGPCTLEPHHPDLFWYGIHGVETLFTIMGTGCESVTRVHTKDTDVVIGVVEGRPRRHVPRHPRGQGRLRRDGLRHQGHRARAAATAATSRWWWRSASSSRPASRRSARRRRSRCSPSWKPPTRANAKAAPGDDRKRDEKGHEKWLVKVAGG